MYFEAVAYKLGMDDSDVRTFDARNMSACSGAGGGGSTSAITLSVWDGDWALLENRQNRVRSNRQNKGQV